jgi:uncharacterized protein YbjT (DUF2867 family)
MRVLVIGATGGTGKLLAERLVGHGHQVRGTSRDAERAGSLRELGVEPLVADLEGDLDHAFTDVDAVAFCAGSGGHTGPDATLRVDLHGAVRTIDLCRDRGIARYVMLSSMAADDPLRGRESIRHYLAAKHAADRILEGSGLDATIVRPGGLTDDEPTGHVAVGVPRLPDRGHISRADVADVMAACLERPSTIGVTFEVIAGETPIDAALAGLVD